ncbi:MAG: ANTAR domain-containing protein [Gaiellaceae bacterium]
MSDGISGGAVVEHARGVLAERFGVGLSKADAILHAVARTQKRSVTELAAAVVASCTTDSTPLPRSLYTSDDAA